MKRFILGIFFILASSHTLLAQEPIKGIVKDDSGSPVPGATVAIKGTYNVSVTDAN